MHHTSALQLDDHGQKLAHMARELPKVCHCQLAFGQHLVAMRYLFEDDLQGA